MSMVIHGGFSSEQLSKLNECEFDILALKVFLIYPLNKTNFLQLVNSTPMLDSQGKRYNSTSMNKVLLKLENFCLVDDRYMADPRLLHDVSLRIFETGRGERFRE